MHTLIHTNLHPTSCLGVTLIVVDKCPLEHGTGDTDDVGDNASLPVEVVLDRCNKIIIYKTRT